MNLKDAIREKIKMNNNNELEFKSCKEKMFKEILDTYKLKSYKVKEPNEITKMDELKIEFHKLKWAIKILIFLLRESIKDFIKGMFRGKNEDERI